MLPEVPKLLEREPPRLLAQFLEGPLAGVDEIVFAERVPGNDHWYANFGYYKFGRSRTPQSLCNISRPGKSLLVRAPLARDAGGLGLCRPEVFSDTSDGDYRAILASIEAAASRHREAKRFDMPGFRPNGHYILQMQRFGVLPEGLASDEAVDCYAADQAYWRSFWYRPAVK